jgi:tetratricopeptide (TPR) repeat protein
MTPPPAQSPPARRRRLWVVAGLLAAVALAAAVGTWAVLTRGATPPPPEVRADAADPAVTALLQKLRARVVNEPRSAAAWGELGEGFFANDREAEGLVCFVQAERLDPADPRWPYFQGLILINRGEREAALPYLERALERGAARHEPGGAPRLVLAETLLTLGRLDDAEAQFQRVLADAPNDARAHFGLGVLLAARQDWQGSRDHLLRCVGSPAAQKKASVQLAVVSQRLGDAAAADRFRSQAEHLPPDLDWNDPFLGEALGWAVQKKDRYRRAESLEAAGRFAEAAAVLRPMTEEYPDDYLPHLMLGRVLGGKGDYRLAEPPLRTALRLAPDKVQAHYYLGLVLLKEGEELSRQDGAAEQARAHFREAADLARQALAVTPDYGFAHMCLGLSLKALGRRDEALAALRKAVRCNPEVAELHYQLGEALADAGQAAEARRHLEHALELAAPDAPWRPAALNRLKADSSGRLPGASPGQPGP